MPLLDEDAFVEANVPYREWLRAAKGRTKNCHGCFNGSNCWRSLTEKAELYNSQNLFVSWTPGYRATRTGMRSACKPSQFFYHREPLIQRREVSLRDELKKPAPILERLPRREGEKFSISQERLRRCAIANSMGLRTEIPAGS